MSVRVSVVLLAISLAAWAQSTVTTKSPSKLQEESEVAPLLIEQSMSAEDFRRAGLNKLSPEEIAHLDAWFRTSVERVWKRSQEACPKMRTQSPSVPAELPTPKLIESRINGDFEGWTGETIFKLQNGQIWQQATYSYRYHYSYSPQVTIFASEGGLFKMKVDGVSEVITVTRLK